MICLYFIWELRKRSMRGAFLCKGYANSPNEALLRWRKDVCLLLKIWRKIMQAYKSECSKACLRGKERWPQPPRTHWPLFFPSCRWILYCNLHQPFFWRTFSKRLLKPWQKMAFSRKRGGLNCGLVSNQLSFRRPLRLGVRTGRRWARTKTGSKTPNLNTFDHRSSTFCMYSINIHVACQALLHIHLMNYTSEA